MQKFQQIWGADTEQSFDSRVPGEQYGYFV